MLGLAGVVAAAAAAPSAGRDLDANTPGCGTDPPWNGWQTLSVPDPLAGRIDRQFMLYVPPNYDSFASTPLVLDYHGYSNQAERHADESGIQEAADEFNFIAVFPQGLDDTEQGNQQAYSWNSVGTVESPGPQGDTCRWADSWGGYACHTSCRPTRGCYSNQYAAGCDCSTCADDVLFTELMINWLEDELCIDLRRIHVTGFSNGGMMSYQLAQSRLGLRIASIAPLCGSPLHGFNVRPARPMAVMSIQGSSDSIIPANCTGSSCGPGGSTVSSDGFYYAPIGQVTDVWGTANDCVGEGRLYPTRYEGQGSFWCMASEGTCRAGGPVVRCAFQGGHTWPFATTVQWARTIWEFFSGNPLTDETRTYEAAAAAAAAKISDAGPAPCDAPGFVNCSSYKFQGQCEAADDPGCCHWCEAAKGCLPNRTACGKAPH